MNPAALLLAMRPQQWVKNVFVLAALGFAYGDSTRRAVTADDLLRTLLAFAAFCIGASAVYLINDVVDIERDRAHPKKRFRPIASGKLSVPAAIGAAVVCIAGSLTLAWFAGDGSGRIAGATAFYVAMNLAYSFKLKRVVLVDAFCIATGFLLRVMAGGWAAHADISHWLLLCTLFLALFLALNKRRAELALVGDSPAAETRATLRQYNLGFLDQMVTVLAACAVMCYAMYTVDSETVAKFQSGRNLVWSVPFVVFGIGRYMLLVQTAQAGESPTRILLGGDVVFALNLLGWLGVVASVVMGFWV